MKELKDRKKKWEKVRENQGNWNQAKEHGWE